MIEPIGSSIEESRGGDTFATGVGVGVGNTLQSVAEPVVQAASGTSVQSLKSCGCATCCVEVKMTAAPIGEGTLRSVNLTGELEPAQKEQLEKLAARDREVRRHEQAHLMAAGRYALGGPSYTYQVGPDGQRYAVGGEVKIDLSPVAGNPEATLDKARQLIRAALAPMEPSGADRQVAARAERMAQDAQRALQKESLDSSAGSSSSVESSSDSGEENESGQEATAAGWQGISPDLVESARPFDLYA